MGVELFPDFNQLVADFWSYLVASGMVAGFLEFASQDPLTMSLLIFFRGGWVFLVLLYTWGIYKYVFLDYRSGQFVSKWKFNLLAIEIPKNNEQTPKAVEGIFASLAGAFSGPNLLDKYWTGKVIESFSFELISIDGYIKFLIRTPSHFRDFVESAVYAQYPDAEITEISDYVDYDSELTDQEGKPIPFKDLTFPNPIYKLWGTEFVLTQKYPFPIRTYEEFEHGLTQQFLDPIGGMLEIMNKLYSGEQLWLQLVIQPREAPYWKSEIVKKVIADLKREVYKTPEKFDPTDIINKPLQGVAGFGNEILREVTGIDLSGESEKKKEEDQFKMLKMSPGERSLLEKVEKKLSKHQFKVKFRMVYLGKNEVFSKTRGVAGVMSALQQFNTSNSNGFKPGGYTKTGADYFFVNQRTATKQNRILRWYCKRSSSDGESNQDEKTTYLNPEELATLWHFPVVTVKASQVQIIGSKKSAPPTRLPYHSRVAPAPVADRTTRITAIKPLGPLDDYNDDSGSIIDVEPLMTNSKPVAPPKPLSGASSPQFSTDNSPSVGVSNPNNNTKGAPPSNLPFV